MIFLLVNSEEVIPRGPHGWLTLESHLPEVQMAMFYLFLIILILLVQTLMSNIDDFDFQVIYMNGDHQDYDEFYHSIESFEPERLGGQENCDEMENSILHIDPAIQEEQMERSRSTSSSDDNSPSRKKATKTRKDPLTHNLAQNLSSNIKTRILKIRGKKHDKKKLKDKYQKFLDQNGAKNNGLIILFAYLFMKRENASPEQMEQLHDGISSFLKKKMNQASKVSLQEGEAYIQKLNIHKRLNDKYLNGCNEEIDVEWVKKVASGLFTGRQGKVITKALATLENIQKSLMSSSLDSLSQSQLIQSFFESSSREMM